MTGLTSIKQVLLSSRISTARVSKGKMAHFSFFRIQSRQVATTFSFIGSSCNEFDGLASRLGSFSLSANFARQNSGSWALILFILDITF